MVKTPFECATRGVEFQSMSEPVDISLSLFDCFAIATAICWVCAIWANYSALVEKLGYLFNGAKDTHDFELNPEISTEWFEKPR